jgi:feruloyl-CoA synthase
VKFLPAAVEKVDLADGGCVLRSPVALGDYARCTGVWLERWAKEAPHRVFLAEHGSGGGPWQEFSYGAALRAARAIGQALIDRGLSPERPIAILSENGVDHALLMLGALHVGVPVVPVSVAYSRQSQDFAKLKHILAVTRPGLVYARDGAAYGKVLTELDLGGAEPVVDLNPPYGVLTLDRLLMTEPTSAVDQAFQRVGPDTIAKILFTSGSTGIPKGVINTQRMLCANQQMVAQTWPFVTEPPLVIVDWLPWNHTFGGNHNMNLVLSQGGSLYVDEGRPLQALIAKTVANLKDIAPTIYFSVPRGYAMLLDQLERDKDLASNFFRRLQLIFYAAASLPQTLWERLDKLAVATIGRKVPILSSWGLTETAPMATAGHFPMDRAGNIGIPAPGCEVKLVPTDGKLEMRVKGPNVTPGYWRDEALTAASFDEEGFYRTGDAGKLLDAKDPAKGLLFDGRLAENFKLSTGTWVNVGELRVAAIGACAPVAEDAVVAGHDRDEVTLLVFPSLAGCRSLCPKLAADAPVATLIAQKPVRAALAAGLARYNAAHPASSTRVVRALFLEEPPSIDRNEITDKGYLNQHAVLEHRAALVERLYAAEGDPAVIVPEEAPAASASRPKRRSPAARATSRSSPA